ncbi:MULTISPECIES: conjugative transposon protein TraM [Hymenobacter]|uniref:Bacteroides conjugative transposon TraM protein n=1 Tax=Hymenobacter mucosus TaxID=1411120 RepID=A0A239AZ57_9BACT|nr:MULTISPECIES: conjugative transposon protein TraM [Hymenobacter]MDF7815523.1 conjugative transposon protein TraM [Hymenobacter sp. YC55]SNS00223.1 Bacteroides conjugative transposon TraM protein [Hymenobacter mucosus]
MATTTKDAQFYRTRKMAVFIPIVGVPFMAAMFWLGDGGKGAEAAGVAPPVAGINTELPKAGASNITSSKLAAYAAPVDSMRNRGLVSGKVDTVSAPGAATGLAYGVAANGQPSSAPADAQVLAAQQQLAAVQAAQQSSGQVAAPATSSLTPEQQMELMRSQHQRELEAARTQATLERINAQTNAGVMASASGGGAAVAVTKPAAPVKKKPATKAIVEDNDAIVSRLGASSGTKRTASFQGLDDGSSANVDANTLPAVIHESQEVVSGSLVKMRLTEPAVVNGHKLAANTFIYGTCSLSGERLSITIETLKAGGSIFPASLEVYDVDGLQGLHIPGTITRDASKQAGADAMGAADMMTMSADPTTAAAGVAVTAVKSLGQKKIRLVKVRLKAGYNIMLKVDKD